MRVVLLGPYPPPHGGVQTNVVGIREFLRRRGIPCAVVNLTRFRRLDAEDVYYPKSALGVLGLLARMRCDIVHLHIGGNATPRLLALGLLCCLLPGRKAVLTFHSGGYPSSREGKTASPRTLRGFVFRRFDRIIAVNPQIQEMFHRFGVPRERVRLIPPYAVAGGREAPLPEALEHFFAAHQPVLLTVGLLEPEYALRLQIDALGAVRARFPKAGLAIIGAGSIERELRTAIAAKPYSEHVLLCGDVPHGATLRAIEECDLFLRTTLYDGDSVAVREALHRGTPVIATDNGMRPEGVRLIPVSDAGALTRAIEESLGAPRSPRRRASEADEENLTAVLELYRELCGERARPAGG